MDRIMMKTMSVEMMRGADADERRDDAADNDETKAAVWENNRQKGGVLKEGGFTMTSCRKMAPVPRRTKSCHLLTSCLFSTSHRPEGDKRACCLIGNRCCEWERERCGGKCLKKVGSIGSVVNGIKLNATGLRPASTKTETQS